MTINRDTREIHRLRREILNSGKLLTEELAGYLIACHLGPGFSSSHIGSLNESADCAISSAGEPQGLVEVMTDTSPHREALFDKILKSEGAERMQLPSGEGAWMCELTTNSRIDDLTPQRICSLLAQLRESNIEEIHLDYTWQHVPLIESLQDLGLHSIRRVDIEGDFIFRFMPIIGGAIDDSADLLADFAEEIVNNPLIEGKLGRLSQRAGNLHRHFCIVIGSNSDLSVQWRMNGISLVSPLPSRAITVPASIDSLWVMSNESGKLLGYSPTNQWTEFSYMATSSPWWGDIDLKRIHDIKKLRERYHQIVTLDRKLPPS